MSENLDILNKINSFSADAAATEQITNMVMAIMDLDEMQITDAVTKSFETIINEASGPDMIQKSVNELKKNFAARNATRAEVREMRERVDAEFEDLINTLQPSAAKRKLLDMCFKPIIDTIRIASEQYHGYDLDLSMTVTSPELIPTYAHPTDTGADLHAAETVVVKAHTYGNLIHTGVKIALPENWTAYIVPRSSIGAKTPLRLSNSVGVIDADYRGEVGVLYDNISDSDYTINAGDRIAQLIVLPAYHFNTKVVDILPTTERGENGYGSTGK